MTPDVVALAYVSVLPNVGPASTRAVSYEKPMRDAVHQHPEYGFIVALICAALALVVASMVFKPAAIGNGITSEIQLVGP